MRVNSQSVYSWPSDEISVGNCFFPCGDAWTAATAIKILDELAFRSIFSDYSVELVRHRGSNRDGNVPQPIGAVARSL